MRGSHVVLEPGFFEWLRLLLNLEFLYEPVFFLLVFV